MVYFESILLLLLDVNECVSSPCKNSGTCLDRVNMYDCDCVSGYTGAMCESGDAVTRRT